MAPIEKVAMRIKALRKRKGWTQAILAAKAGIGRVHLAKLETARQDPTLATLEKIAKAFRVKLSALVD